MLNFALHQLPLKIIISHITAWRPAGIVLCTGSACW